MVYYEISADFAGVEYAAMFEKREERRDEMERIRLITEQFNLDNPGTIFAPVRVDGNIMWFVCVVSECENLPKRFATYLASLGILFEKLNPREITLSRLDDLISSARRYGFVTHPGDFLNDSGLDDAMDWIRANSSSEELIDVFSLKGCREICKDFLTGGALLEEIGRIYEGTKDKKVFAHPVHYIVECDDRETVELTLQALISALYVKERLLSSRITNITPECCGNPHSVYSSLGKAAAVVRINRKLSDFSGYRNRGCEFVETVADICSQNSSDVLTVFCVPKQCDDIKNMIYSAAKGVHFVEITEELADHETARRYLKAAALRRNMKPDRKLYGRLDGMKNYSTESLSTIFGEWMGKKLRNDIFPQYNNVGKSGVSELKKETMGMAIDELNSMIGLDEVKKNISNILDYHKTRKYFADHGICEAKPSNHMVFTGNPGTAKTTVASLFGRIMNENGILEKDVFVEVGRADIVGQYVGTTAPLVKKKFEEADGGILFIDEAYSLVDDRNGLFGDEAINTIVQEMENRRDSVCVILAGYPDKMEEFLRKNPGLRSRFPNQVHFEDYNTDELLRIAGLMAEKQGLSLSGEAEEKLKTLFDSARMNEDFGNGRYVRNVLDKAKMAHSSRIVNSDFESMNAGELALITASDIELPQLKKTEKKFRCGFCA